MKKFSTLILEEDITQQVPAQEPAKIEVVRDEKNKNAISVDILAALKQIQSDLLTIDFLELTKYVNPDSDMSKSLKGFEAELSQLRKDVEDCITKNHTNIVNKSDLSFEPEEVTVAPDEENVEKIAIKAEKTPDDKKSKESKEKPEK